MTAATGGPEAATRVGPATAVDDAARVATRRERTAAMLQRSGAFLILAVVTLIASLVFGTRFASVDNFLNILEASSFLGLIAVGMTFVIIGGGIDLSVGSLLALSAVLAAYGSQYGSVARRGSADGGVRSDRPVQRLAHRPGPDGRRSS